MNNYSFNIVFNTTGSSLKNEYIFNLSPLTYSINELVIGKGTAYIDKNEMKCILLNNYISEAVSVGFSSSFMNINLANSFTPLATAKPDTMGNVNAYIVPPVEAIAKPDTMGNVNAIVY